MKIIFTHYWVSGFGWEPTIFQAGDFDNVEKLGENDIDGILFITKDEGEGNHIFKGRYE